MKDLKAFINKDVLKRMRHNSEHKFILVVIGSPDYDIYKELGITIFYNSGYQHIAAIKIDDMKNRVFKELLDYNSSIYFKVNSDIMEALNFAIKHKTEDYENSKMFERIGRYNELKKFLDTH